MRIKREYRIKTNGDIITVERKDGEIIAQYRGRSAAAMRRDIDAHMAQPGATLDNYQW